MDMSNFFQIRYAQSIFNQLGTTVANEYVPFDNCHLVLMYIHEKLITEDNNALGFRQTIGFAQLVQSDLIPMLITMNNEKTLELLIKILANIMTPIESLMPVDNDTEEKTGYSTIFKLDWLLSTNKVAFANIKAIKRILQIIRDNITKLSSTQEYIVNQQNSIINDCLRLIKNILHVPNDQYQDQILRMLFSEQFDEIIIDLIANTHRKHWAVLVIELIALVFKDQHVDQMSKLLSKMNEAIKIDGSEDDESNTSSQTHRKNGTSSSPGNSTESTSDENDNDQHSNVLPFKEKLLDTNMIHDHGKRSSKQNINANLVNQKVRTKFVFKEPSSLFCDISFDLKRRDSKEENKVNVVQRRSPIRVQKHGSKDKLHTIITVNPIDHNEAKLRKKKYTKKNVKTKLKSLILPLHMPSQACTSFFLQKFTIRFLRNGFNTLVDDVYYLLTSNTQKCINTSLYFWILTYFSRFCRICGVELKLVRRIVSFKLISFIVHEGLKISEQLMLAKRKKSHDIHLQARNLHLVIMAIKEVIKTIEYYRQTAVSSPIYVELINDLRNSSNNSPESITWANDLKSIFVLLIRHYDSKIQVTEYLHDLIVTNHMVLSLFDNLKDCWNLNNSITDYIKKFAAPDIMFKYGMVLKDYKNNEEIVNEAVFTMMHHIIGEVENTTVLLQPIILKIFFKIFDNKENLYERWSDLIDFVRNKFLNLVNSSEFNLKKKLERIPCECLKMSLN